MKKRIKYLTTLLLLPLLFSCNNENISTETKIVESSSEEVTLSKPDGTATFLPVDPSNLVIIDADLKDDRRIKNKGDN
jgi:large subunit ribosomal protein L24